MKPGVLGDGLGGDNRLFQRGGRPAAGKADDGVAQGAEVLLDRQAADEGVVGQGSAQARSRRIEHQVFDALGLDFFGQAGQAIEAAGRDGQGGLVLVWPASAIASQLLSSAPQMQRALTGSSSARPAAITAGSLLIRIKGRLLASRTALTAAAKAAGLPEAASTAKPSMVRSMPT